MSEIKNTWSENVVLVDCSFMDALLKDFTAHFSTSIGRKLEKADLCHWLDCLMLDAAVPAKDQQHFVVFIHAKSAKEMPQMMPGQFDQLNGQAFTDHLGEFVMNCYPVEKMTTTREFMIESFRAAMEAPDVKRILVVGDTLAYGEGLKKSISDRKKVLEEAKQSEPLKDITLFTMHPTAPSPLYKEVILGYSVMSALGIRSEELQ